MIDRGRQTKIDFDRSDPRPIKFYVLTADLSQTKDINEKQLISTIDLKIKRTSLMKRK